WQYVNRLAVSANGSTLLSATRSGGYRSLDGGATWSNTTVVELTDVAFHPTDSNKAVASGFAGNAYYTNNGGATWVAASGLPGGSIVRVELAYARSSPNIVYASVDKAGGSIYVSADGGATYTLVFSGSPDYLGNQGWYDNALWVDPTNANTIV